MTETKGTDSTTWTIPSLMQQLLRLAAPVLCTAGICGLVIGGIAWIALLFAEHVAPRSSMFFRIFALAVVPSAVLGFVGILVLGLVATGYERRLRGENIFPQIDFRRGDVIKSSVGWLVFLVVLAVAGAYDAVKAYEFTESNEFCGQLCHAVMSPEGIAHKGSPHANVHCVECHVGPGVFHYAKSKLEGLRELASLATNSYHRPMQTPLEKLRPTSVICEQCHWPEKFHGRTVQDHAYFLADEENTRSNMTMLMHVGGGEPRNGVSTDLESSVHWHVNSRNRVFYIATDERREKIPYVKMIDENGGEVVFVDEEADVDVDELLKTHELREMNCLDCHNRTVHDFTRPDRLLNTAMATGKVNPAIPWIKSKALKALTAEYTTKEGALKAIGETLTGYYKEEHVDLAEDVAATIPQSIEAVQEIYDSAFFPEMKTQWSSHPNHIGHLWTAGCFRCHGGLHVAGNDRRISRDCGSCHGIIGQSKGKERADLTNPQEFKHPEDIEEMWKEMPCTDCHTGAGATL